MNLLKFHSKQVIIIAILAFFAGACGSDDDGDDPQPTTNTPDTNTPGTNTPGSTTPDSELNVNLSGGYTINDTLYYEKNNGATDIYLGGTFFPRIIMGLNSETISVGNYDVIDASGPGQGSDEISFQYSPDMNTTFFGASGTVEITEAANGAITANLNVTSIDYSSNDSVTVTGNFTAIDIVILEQQEEEEEEDPETPLDCSDSTAVLADVNLGKGKLAAFGDTCFVWDGDVTWTSSSNLTNRGNRYYTYFITMHRADSDESLSIRLFQWADVNDGNGPTPGTYVLGGYFFGCCSENMLYLNTPVDNFDYPINDEGDEIIIYDSADPDVINLEIRVDDLRNDDIMVYAIDVNIAVKAIKEE